MLSRSVIEIIPKGSLAKALESGKKLRLKLGLDPSKPDLHIGHAVLLRKLRTLQEMGHQVVLIVGDWTARIGDPSGQSIMRPMLTAEEVKANAETYMRQFFHVVDKKKTEVRWQSEWFDDFKLNEVIRLAGRFTVAQMLQREPPGGGVRVAGDQRSQVAQAFFFILFQQRANVWHRRGYGIQFGNLLQALSEFPGKVAIDLPAARVR
ncbi:MAG: tyrosine--tRNA ligase [Chloroflexi bacterium]|nr:tyrosine--tRNA ligase [Chloroflexota bacterium]